MEVLNDINRLRIICFLQRDKEFCVCEIVEILDLPQNLVSYHLSLLKNNGLLLSRREGNKILYKRNEVEFKKFQELLKQL